MNVDTWLATTSDLLLLLIAVVAGHLSVTKLRHKAFFWVAGVVSAGLIVWHSVVIAKSQARAEADAIVSSKLAVNSVREIDSLKEVVASSGAEIKETVTRSGTELKEEGQKRLAVSKEELALKYVPQIAVIYAVHQIQIHNDGATNVFLWGTQLEGEAATIEALPRVIAPQAFYYIFGDALEKVMTSRLVADEARRRVQIFVADVKGRKYVVNVMIFARRLNEVIEIHTQTIDIVRKQWR